MQHVLPPLDDHLFSRTARKKAVESKAHKRPNLPCAWYFALYRFAKRESRYSTSRDAFAPPTEDQRDHEQHKEYKEQKFRDAR